MNKNNSYKTCLLCGSTNTEFLLSKCRDGEHDHHICLNCGFIFQKRIDYSIYTNGDFSVEGRGTKRCSPEKAILSDEMAKERYEKVKQKGSFKNVLDIGCGIGSFMRYMRFTGAQAIGIEPDAEFTETSHESIQNIFFEDFKAEAPFDLITSFHVLEHVNDPDGFFQKCHELLSDDGLLFLEIPCVDRMYGTVDHFFWGPHINVYSTKVFQSFLAKAGFEVFEIDWRYCFLQVFARKADKLDYTSHFDDPKRIKRMIQMKKVKDTVVFWK